MALFQEAYVLGSSPSRTERELVERLQAGDRSAIEELYHSYYDGLCSFTLGMTHSRDDVEDLVQEIFVRIWTNRESWNPKGPVKTYLFKAARNQALNFVKNRNHRHVTSAGDEDEFPSSPDADPLNRLEEKDMLAVVNAAISDLPEKCRLVFVLNRQEGLAYSEIAEVMGISRKTVENQISRALKILRKNLITLKKLHGE